jgi:uncharacterized Ntn-hydrolase superfamily protein
VSGHLISAGASVQGNMLASAEVLPAMSETFGSAGGGLVDRLLAALTAGQDAGGDLRGRQSAALLVVSGSAVPDDDDDGIRIDLRVDDSADPVAQLRLMRNLQRAYEDRDYETLALFAPEGARDLYAALAAVQRGNRVAARTALEAMRARPGWSAWLATMAGDPRVSALSRLLE